MTKKEKCSWTKCKNKINVDHSNDFSIFIHVGWCKFHEKMYDIQCDLFSKLDKNKHHSDISNDLWLNDKKKYRVIQKTAFNFTTKKIRKNSK